MGDTVLKRLQVAQEGMYTPGGSSSSSSVYNGGSPVVAVRRLAVKDDLMFDWEDTWQRVVEARGTYAALYQSIFQMRMAKGKFSANVYPDDMIDLLRMTVSGAPTVTTLPTTPTALLAATVLSAGGNSLTTQPNATGDTAVGKMLAVTLSNAAASTAAVTITIAGTSTSGASLSEQVAFTAGTTTPSAVGGGAGALSCTLYTKNYFATVNAAGITSSAQPSGDDVAIGGVSGFLWTFLADMGSSTLLSYTGEYVDGTAAWQLSGLVADKLTLKAQTGKETSVDISAFARSKLALAGSTGSINSAASAGDPQAVQNLADSIYPALSSGLMRLYADPMGTAPGTTLVNNRLIDYQFEFDPQVKPGKAADGSPYPSFVGRGSYGDKLIGAFTLLFNGYAGTVDPAMLTNYLTQASMMTRVAIPGPTALPCGALNTTGGWPASLQDASGHGGLYGLAFDVGGKLTKGTEKPDNGRQSLDFTLESEVDLTSLNAPCQVLVVSRRNPNT